MTKHYHFIGIGGIGMSALALILLQRGIALSGSDLASSYVTEKLKQHGARVFIGHQKENVQGATHVVYNTQVFDHNPEIQQAKADGLHLIHRSDLLAELMQNTLPLLVAGTHGKTTTSSLLAHTLVVAGQEPSYAIGGMVASLKGNGAHGNGKYFVAEACESDGTFLKYPAFGAIITNCDNDHLDFWKTEEKLLEGFKRFSEGILSEEHFFWCGDDAQLTQLNLQGTHYGFSPKSALQITSSFQRGWESVFSLSFDGKTIQDVTVPLIGKHNVLNASGVFGLCMRLGIPEDVIRAGFASFKGVGRRAEKKGEVSSIVVYDDYAHHPTEIRATIEGLRSASNGNRLVVVFQPHRYTRTRDCMEEFAHAFNKADHVIITDIYEAMESPIEGINAEVLCEKIKRENRSVEYIPKSQLCTHLTNFLMPLDICVTMGAGDITKIGPEVLNNLKQRQV